jgi:hypothetical protein
LIAQFEPAIEASIDSSQLKTAIEASAGSRHCRIARLFHLLLSGMLLGDIAIGLMLARIPDRVQAPPRPHR